MRFKPELKEVGLLEVWVSGTLVRGNSQGKGPEVGVSLHL